jgi:methyltransferase (TIGR00027 family)
MYARARESQSIDPILVDEKAVEITRRLNPLLAASPDRLLRSLASGKMSKQLYVHLALRARKYDEYTCAFLECFPQGTVVNLGCGMDTRFHRVDNRRAYFFDLDLPEVIHFKRKFVQESPRYCLIAASVFDYNWMNQVEKLGASPVLFLAEGLFPYLDPHKVRALFVDLLARFSGSEMVCEVVNSRWLSKSLKPIVNFKMQREAGIGKGAVFQFGIADSHEPESWSSGIRLIDDWSYFDTRHPKLGLVGMMGRFEMFRKTQWTVHYRLG